MNTRVYNAPLSDEKLQQLDLLLRDLDEGHIEWLLGYLSGWRAARNIAKCEYGQGAAGTVELTILFASQTGNTESVAALLADKAKASGMTVKVFDMADYKLRQLKNERYLAILTSTHGEGSPPDGAMDFYEFLHSRKAPELKGLQYGVLSLGDSSYEYFCQTGKDFDARLRELGATAIVSRVDCDVDYDNAAEKWMQCLISTLSKSSRAAAAPFSLPVLTGTRHDRRTPFLAPLLENQLLSGRGSNKEVRHIELSLGSAGLRYQPGDALGVYPQNDPELVAQLIQHCAFDPEQIVELNGQSCSVREALMSHREITMLTRSLLKKWAELAQSDALMKLIADKTASAEWLRGRDVLDLVRAFPLPGYDAAIFLDLLRKLSPRLYSISSSQAVVGEEVHITVAAVRYQAHGRERHGVASVWLADRLTSDAVVPVYIESNKNFKLPDDDDAPIIMIGPGTGVAPFRSFIQEREARGARGRNWLFFGDQHFRTDFLYQTEWLAWRKSGLLTSLDLAFSRDQAEKHYVQHRIRAKSREVWAWLQEGAYLYVCGDADNLAPDVNQALLDVISQHGHKSFDEAREFLRDLSRDKRYQRDVY
ncbi:assimilatory sulfite reductase (NADPH) flavoprotein subunit [Nitrosomonas halophila]|uniref:Sulfite reductase [NADPH] flavoprotein alpha-component n=1 Tax=Nitrosomonas halophila TaxID=44576 RepID=A0A1H3NSF4_9PROT|nr:assimilatory sulfite reductase (NADPH) flavoprotein subunit [Nitrosomonas halophila]SDY91109.1 sulfite reductase (NADPH) flavoprotein alpha-component [Nitrosomonas halophila]